MTLGSLAIILSVFVALWIVLSFKESNGSGNSFPREVSKNQIETLDEEFSFLVATHPEEVIRYDLLQLFLSKEILYIFVDSSETGSQSAAGFALIDREDIQLVSGSVIEREGLIPFFALEKSFIRGNISDTAKQSLIYHEYQHYLQWREGIYPEHVLVLGGVVETAEEMEIVYAGEVDAYTKQCMFVVEFDVLDEVSVCYEFERKDMLAFREQIVRILLEKEEHRQFESLLLELTVKN